jgi:hypothetical protein
LGKLVWLASLAELSFTAFKRPLPGAAIVEGEGALATLSPLLPLPVINTPCIVVWYKVGRETEKEAKRDV